jgi:hypothetical protein
LYVKFFLVCFLGHPPPEGPGKRVRAAIVLGKSFLFWPVPARIRGNNLSGCLNAVRPDCLGCVFEVWPAPEAREGPQKCGGLRPPPFEGLPPGPARLQKRTPTNPARLLSSTQFIECSWDSSPDSAAPREGRGGGCSSLASKLGLRPAAAGEASPILQAKRHGLPTCLSSRRRASLPGRVPGEGPDGYRSKTIGGAEPAPARLRGVSLRVKYRKRKIYLRT